MMKYSDLKNRVLDARLGNHTFREWIYPAYVKLYPWLFWMGRFEFDRKRYHYMFHPYGATLRGERIVELPIVLEELKHHAGQRILEVGNVLSHYVPIHHDVVDKYEKAPGCMNYDIVGYRPSGLYDFIVSISTVEHIGWNEYEKDPEKSVRALHYMKSLLKKGGRMMVTMPWGENPALDAHLRSARCIFDSLRFMKRISRRNTWRQATAEALDSSRYGSPYPFGNVLVIGTVAKN